MEALLDAVLWMRGTGEISHTGCDGEDGFCVVTQYSLGVFYIFIAAIFSFDALRAANATTGSNK